MTSLEPFYPCQTVDGSTYVMDGRTNRIAATIATSSDTAERWREAKRKARKLNDDHVRRTFARRRRVAFWIVALTILAGLTLILVR